MEECLTAPDVVWCCAGFSRPGFFVDVPIQEHRQQMDTVYWTSFALGGISEVGADIMEFLLELIRCLGLDDR
jgi:hypothetical protein